MSMDDFHDDVPKEPAVKVTMTKVYDTLLEVRDTVNPLPAIVAKHDAAILSHENRITKIETRDDTTNRLNGLRPRAHWSNIIAGVASVVATVIALFALIHP